MGNIVLLDDLTINKIAAGEVIERPASVVKEIVENSIDAGASKITVEIKNGGISLIKVTDNGKGIREDDMEIAFERHATSKIRQAEDILKITSMGFRGEALASIAAIANVEMISRTEDSTIGHRIVVEGGKILEKNEIGSSLGTTITVTNLFFNTPVRYKFLKKDYTESGYIEDAITRLALVNKNIAFKLINNGKTIIQTNGDGEFKSVIYSIYGKDIADAIIETDYELEGVKVTGVVGKPEIARNNRAQQLFFVNGRYIKDKTLSAAADQAFKGIVTLNKYGFLILNVNLSPELVDVNVHPAKLEVRFEEENKVFKAVYHAIKAALAKSELVENVVKPKEDSNTFSGSNPFGSTFSTNKIASDSTTEARVNPEISGGKINPDINFNKESINENEKNRIDRENKNEKQNTNKFGLKNLFGKKHDSGKDNFEDFGNDEDIKNKTQNDKDDTEGKGNLLEEIYQFRKGLAKLGISEVTPTANYDINKIIEEDGKLQEELKTNKLGEEASSYTTSNEEKAGIPSEDQVDKVTEQLLKQRASENIYKYNKNELDQNENSTDESQKNKESENTKNTENVENIPEENVKLEFGDMYKKIFGESVIKIDDETAKKELTEGERKILDDIKRKVLEDEGIVSSTRNNEKNNSDDSNMLESENEDLDTVNINDTLLVNKPREDEKLEVKDIVINKNNSEVLPDFRDIKEQGYKFLGIAFSTYIIIEVADEMYIIDQHAAHERIMYEKVKKNYYSTTDKDCQLMLMPDVISLTHKEAEIVKENLEMFEKAGFMLEAFGENTIKLTGVPNFCIDLNTKQLFIDLIDEVNNFSRTALQEKEDKFIATIACKAAVKGNMKLNDAEVKQLLDELLKLPNPFTCPHGRPTAIKYTKYDLERKFSRK